MSRLGVLASTRLPSLTHQLQELAAAGCAPTAAAAWDANLAALVSSLQHELDLSAIADAWHAVVLALGVGVASLAALYWIGLPTTSESRLSNNPNKRERQAAQRAGTCALVHVCVRVRDVRPASVVLVHATPSVVPEAAVLRVNVCV